MKINTHASHKNIQLDSFPFTKYSHTNMGKIYCSFVLLGKYLSPIVSASLSSLVTLLRYSVNLGECELNSCRHRNHERSLNIL